MEAFQELSDIDYAKRLSVIALDSLTNSQHISEEEKNWLLEQMFNDQKHSEEEIQKRHTDELLCRINERFIKIAPLLNVKVSLKINPDQSGELHNESDSGPVFEFGSFEEGLIKMRDLFNAYK